MVSLMELSVVGNGNTEACPLLVARLLPNTEIIPQGDMPPDLLKLAAFTTPSEVTAGGGAALTATCPLIVCDTGGSGNCTPRMVTVAGFAVDGFQVAE